MKGNNPVTVPGQLNWQIPNEQFACDHNPFTRQVNDKNKKKVHGPMTCLKN